MFYCWKWHYCNGEKIIKQVEAELIVHGEKTRSIQIKISTRTLGTHLTRALEWRGKFEVIRKHLHASITKLMNVDINPCQAAIYFNVYVMTSVVFGSRVVSLTESQEKEFKRMQEDPILIKLVLSKKFTRAALCSRKSALGVGLMEPSTIIDMLELKLFVGNMRKKAMQRNPQNFSYNTK